MGCPDENLVNALAYGNLNPREREAIDNHVDGCPDCRRRVMALVRSLSTMQTGGPPSPSTVRPAMPAQIGRYRIIEVLGQGGMGLVYRAYDPELHREIAVKLLSPHATRDGDTEAARGRLLREAQAMARVNHVNVISVYDVGTFADQVYLAIELAPNGTLRAWQHDRPWREILAAYSAAGRGLSAAHAVGLIHRDFKPDNVLIGIDGRIRVTDFGLARIEGALTGERTTGGMLDVPLTATGAVMGTPGYMAPEQMDGVATDARTDQFAFCIALWEALYGGRPYPGATIPQVRAAIATHTLSATSNAQVPTSVRDALVRGLAADPAKRWPSMDALLAHLAPSPAPRRNANRIVAVAGAGGLIAIVIVAVVASQSKTASPAAATPPTPATTEPAVARAPGCITTLTSSSVPAGDIVLARACGPVTIEGGVTLDTNVTIEAGVQLRFKQNASLFIGWSKPAKLIARGTADAPIVFTTAGDEVAGAWGEVYIGATADGSTITHAIFRFGGSTRQTGDHPAELEVHGVHVTLDHVTFLDSASFGLLAPESAASFAALSGCTFERVATGAMRIHPMQLTGLGGDNTYDAKAVVEVSAGTLADNATLHAGPRYRIANLTVERPSDDMPVPTLAIEPGVTIEAMTDQALTIGWTRAGRLAAIGLPSNPIRFTGMDKRNAAWAGIRFTSTTRESAIQHALVEYAFQPDTKSAVRIDKGAEVSLLDIKVAHTKGVGIVAPVDPHVVLVGISGDDVTTAQRLDP